MSDFRFRVEGKTSGTETLPSGTETGTLVAAWDSVPSRVWLGMETDDGSVILATVDGDPRDDGFDFSLSAAPETTGCKLHWICNF